MKQYIEAGVLGAPRGTRGEIRFRCWCDSPDFLVGVGRFYLDAVGGKSLEVKLYRPTVPSIVFAGYEDRESAALLAGKTLWFDRDSVSLPQGVFFNDDLIGLPVRDADSGRLLGTLVSVEESGRGFLYRIRGEKEYLVPAVDEFVLSRDLEKGVTVRLIEGMETD